MKGYTTGEAARLVGLTERQTREYGRSGVLDAVRDERGHYTFTFQDLVLLRTARSLLDASVPQRRILRALLRLKEQLPSERSLAEVRIYAEGDDVVARHRGRAWDPESGQLRLTFDVADLAADALPLDREAPGDGAGREGVGGANAPGGREGPDEPDGRAADAAAWLERAITLETDNPVAAMEAYERVLALAPDDLDALVNLGRLVHEGGDVERAVSLYTRALDRSDSDDPIAAFNLGIALEDLGRYGEAQEAYQRAVEADPGFADAHYNLSRMCERVGDRVSALRYLKNYRSLTSGSR